MLSIPTTHFVARAKAILHRDARLSLIWSYFTALVIIEVVYFSMSLARFRKAIGRWHEVHYRDLLPENVFALSQVSIFGDHVLLFIGGFLLVLSVYP